MSEPFSTVKVRQLIKAILSKDELGFSGHAYEEMRKDNLIEVDVRNALNSGRVEPGELERGTYRYRVLTQKIGVVIAFRSETRAVVVTAWRIRSR